MESAPSAAGSPDTIRPETEAERRDRLAWEADGIAEADAELEAGLYVDAADIRAWIESIGTDQERPPPPTRHR
jgi:predicted transcriptional regulator